MALAFAWQNSAAALIGALTGLNIGFALGAWWQALRAEARAADEADIRDHQS